MTNIENLILLISHSLGSNLSHYEVHRMKSDIHNVSPKLISEFSTKIVEDICLASDKDVTSINHEICAILFDAVGYRVKLRVHEYTVIDKSVFYFCPRCRALVDREYLAYCDCCGQHLSWEDMKHAKRVSDKG